MGLGGVWGGIGGFLGGLGDLLSFYPLLVGCLVVSLFALHGSVFLFLKMESDLQDRLKPLMWKCFGMFLVLYLFSTVITLVTIPQAVEPFRTPGPSWLVVSMPAATWARRPATRTM